MKVKLTNTMIFFIGLLILSIGISLTFENFAGLLPFGIGTLSYAAFKAMIEDLNK